MTLWLEKWRPFGQSSPDVFDWICMYAYADFTGVFFPSGHTWIVVAQRGSPVSGIVHKSSWTFVAKFY